MVDQKCHPWIPRVDRCGDCWPSVPVADEIITRLLGGSEAVRYVRVVASSVGRSRSGRHRCYCAPSGGQVSQPRGLRSFAPDALPRGVLMWMDWHSVLESETSPPERLRPSTVREVAAVCRSVPRWTLPRRPRSPTSRHAARRMPNHFPAGLTADHPPEPARRERASPAARNPARARAAGSGSTPRSARGRAADCGERRCRLR
jgi:hypothetical protein